MAPSAVEQRYKVGRALAERFGLRVESFRASLAAAGVRLEKPGIRGLYVSSSELEKYVAWTRRRAGGTA